MGAANRATLFGIYGFYTASLSVSQQASLRVSAFTDSVKIAKAPRWSVKQKTDNGPREVVLSTTSAYQIFPRNTTYFQSYFAGRTQQRTSQSLFFGLKFTAVKTPDYLASVFLFSRLSRAGKTLVLLITMQSPGIQVYGVYPEMFHGQWFFRSVNDHELCGIPGFLQDALEFECSISSQISYSAVGWSCLPGFADGLALFLAEKKYPLIYLKFRRHTTIKRLLKEVCQSGRIGQSRKTVVYAKLYGGSEIPPTSASFYQFYLV